MLEAAIESALAEGQRVLVKVDAVWCSMCRDLDRVLEAPAGAAAVGELTVLTLDFDAPESPSLIQRLAILELPTVVVLERDGVEAGRVVGFTEGAAWCAELREVLAQGNPVPGLRAQLVEDPTDRAAAYRLGEALLSRAPTEGQARLEALAFGEDAWAAEALHALGRYRHRALGAPAAAMAVWRELCVRLPDDPRAVGALVWYARAQADVGHAELGSRAFAARHRARPRDAGLVIAWARFAGRQGLEVDRADVREAAMQVLSTARGAARDDLENLVMGLGQPFTDSTGETTAS